MPFKIDGITYYFRLDAKYDYFYDQKELCDRYRQSSEAAKFGVCKALCVSWIRYSGEGKHFIRDILQDENEQRRMQNEASILLISKDEVLEMDTMVNLIRMGEGGQQLIEYKKNWVNRYLARYGFVSAGAESVDSTDPATMATCVSRHVGYQLFYYLNGNDLGHCIAIYHGGDGQGTHIFDPNFGVFIIPGIKIPDLTEFFDCFAYDYRILFAMAQAGRPVKFRVERFA
jgi:hypothetical protein